ncbi:hypothetical protein VPHK469_0102 [Vibrio phage K469]
MFNKRKSLIMNVFYGSLPRGYLPKLEGNLWL